MRPFRALVWGCALAVLAAGTGQANAAWNNVFQLCCNTCNTPVVPAPPPVTSVTASFGAAACPPTQTCTTRYVQRSFYQQVTSFRTSFYQEPVTTYRTSYFWEPVTTFRTSCYVDPCNPCVTKQVVTPCTSFRLRSQCCPVTSFIQRSCQVPVTSWQQSCYYEPVTTCTSCTTTTTVGAPVTSLPPGASMVPSAPSAPIAPSAPVAPSVPLSEPPPNPAAPPTTEETRDHGVESRRYPAPPVMPRASDSSLRQPPAPRPAPAPTTLRPDRIASYSHSSFEGHVVSADRSPRSNARVLLVNAERSTDRRTVTTDGAGDFRANLTAGGWLVYLHDTNGRPVFARRVEVNDHTQPVTLVGR
jgi:hypothetical protein